MARGTKFYPCGGCAKKGAYVLSLCESSGLVYLIQCRYCGAMEYRPFAEMPKDHAAACAAIMPRRKELTP